MMSEQAKASQRRVFLMQVAGASGVLAVGVPISLVPTGSALGADAGASAAQVAPVDEIPAGYASLSPDEATFVEAVVNVMCPADGLTPSGVDCGLATYIDRQL